MSQDSSGYYTSDILNQLDYDFLSFPIEKSNVTTNQKFSSSFYSDPKENSSNGLIANPHVSLSQDQLSFLTQQETSILHTPDYSLTSVHPLQNTLHEEFLTPLVSPAITPSYTDIYEFLDPSSNSQYFTPLSSPALPPNINNNVLNEIDLTSIENDVILSQKLVQIELQQQVLREQLINSPTGAYRKSPLTFLANINQTPPSPLPFNGKRVSLRHKIALSSPQLNPSLHNNDIIQSSPAAATTPATPASLLKMTHSSSVTNTFSNTINNADYNAAIITKKRKLAPSSPTNQIVSSSPRTLKPLISPYLQPSLNNQTNTITPIIENRRSAHKVAEQKRRDTLKQSFDSLRKEITDVLVMDEAEENKLQQVIRIEKEKEVKLMSKVMLLQHSYEYIIRLKKEGKLKDEKMEKMQLQLNELKSKIK